MCWSSKHFLQTSLTAPLLSLLEGQDHTFQFSEGMGASFSSYSAWKSQFANVFQALSSLEKLQGEAEQTCQNNEREQWVILRGAPGAARRKGEEINWRREQIPPNLPSDKLEFVPVLLPVRYYTQLQVIWLVFD